MKTLLVPTDLSKPADSALNFAIGFAQKEKAEIVLLHVFRLRVVFPEESGEIDTKIDFEEEKKINKSLEKKCNEITHSKKVKCRFITSSGLTVDEIIETADKLKPDLIIMGTKGATGATRVILGSNTASIIEKSRYPVIAVPAGTKFAGLKRITYATNYHTSDISAIRELVAIAKPFRAAINVLHITTGELTNAAEKDLLDTYASKVSRKVNYNNISFQLIHSGNVAKTLENYVKSDLTDLLAMSTLHRDFLEKLFGRSVTKRMAYHADVPLLAFHHMRDAAVLL